MLIRPKLKFASTIWGSASPTHLKLIESTEERVLRFIYHNFKLNHFIIMTTCVLILDQKELNERRKYFDFKFINNVLTCIVSSYYPLTKLFFRVCMYGTRKSNFILTKFSWNSSITGIVKVFKSMCFSLFRILFNTPYLGITISGNRLTTFLH